MHASCLQGSNENSDYLDGGLRSSHRVESIGFVPRILTNETIYSTLNFKQRTTELIHVEMGRTKMPRVRLGSPNAPAIHSAVGTLYAEVWNKVSHRHEE